jgi:hypothetical protein
LKLTLEHVAHWKLVASPSARRVLDPWPIQLLTMTIELNVREAHADRLKPSNISGRVGFDVLEHLGGVHVGRLTVELSGAHAECFA